ncbi:hypothetical protein EBZ38_14605 [bacterium]|nr:hypothetical protein [bacterium]NDD85489.1 hypothetical protein [bacterium]
MNYYIEKHDMEIILDALEVLHNQMKIRMDFGVPTEQAYSVDDVYGVFQSVHKSFNEEVK